MGSSAICGLTGALSRSAFTSRVIDSSGLLVPLGMLLGESGSLLKRGGRLAQQGSELLCDLPRLICRPSGGAERAVSPRSRATWWSRWLRGSASAIAGSDLALDRGLLPAKAGQLTLQAVVRAFQALSVVT